MSRILTDLAITSSYVLTLVAIATVFASGTGDILIVGFARILRALWGF